MRRFVFLALLLGICVGGSLPTVLSGVATAQTASEKPALTSQSTLPIQGSNYVTFIQDHENAGLGQVTFRTGAAHPLASRSLLYGGATGRPGTSFFTVRSWTSRTDYVQRVGPALSSFSVVGLNSFGQIAASTPQGIVTNYSLPGGTITPDRLLISQTVELVDGLGSMGVGVTVTITNLGTSPVALGFRALWDAQLDHDDGPAWVAPDGALVSHEATLASAVPVVFDLMTPVLSSGSLTSLWLTGLMAGQVGLASASPDRLQYADWASASATAFDYTTDPTRVIAQESAADSAILTYFGDTEEQALHLAAGASATIHTILLTRVQVPGDLLKVAGADLAMGAPGITLQMIRGQPSTSYFFFTCFHAWWYTGPASNPQTNVVAFEECPTPNDGAAGHYPGGLTTSFMDASPNITFGVLPCLMQSVPTTGSYPYLAAVRDFNIPTSVATCSPSQYKPLQPDVPGLKVTVGGPYTYSVTVDASGFPAPGSYDYTVQGRGALCYLFAYPALPRLDGYKCIAQDVKTPTFTVSVVAPPPPTVPSGLTATPVSTSQINLSWQPSTGPVGVAYYQVFRNGAQITTTPATSYSDTGRAPSTTYTYTVAACDGGGTCSAQSILANATTFFSGTPVGETTKSTPQGVPVAFTLQGGGCSSTMTFEGPAFVTFDPSSLPPPGTQQVGVNVKTETLPLGSHSITITARCGSETHNFTFTVNVTAPPPTLQTDDRTVTSVPSAQSISAFLAPPQATDRVFVGFPDRRDQYLFADTPTGAANRGVFTINILVSRVVGEVDSLTSLLREADRLIANGVIAPTATLRVMAFDVDRVTASALQDKGLTPETVTVKFNGESIGTLRGGNEIWLGTVFTVDIKKVRFPSLPLPGQAPQPAMNTVTITVDTQTNPTGVVNAGLPAWGAAVDWAALSIKALSPVVLIHGWHGNPGNWKINNDGVLGDVMGFVPLFEGRGIPFSGVALPEAPFSSLSDGIENHGRALAGLVPEFSGASLSSIARRWGVDSLHLIAHSKGGLDAREFLERYASIFEQGTIDAAINPTGQHFTILSLTTLGTPHRGSILADHLAVIDELTRAKIQTVGSEIQGITTLEAITLAGIAANFLEKFPATDGLRDLTTRHASAFNDSNLPGLPPGTVYLSISADADQNRDEKIQLEETRGLDKPFDPSSPLYRKNVEFIYTTLYQFLRDISQVTWRIEERQREICQFDFLDCLFGSARTTITETFLVTTFSGMAAPQGNDAFVTQASAKDGATFRNVMDYAGSTGRNHTTIMEQDVAETVVFPNIKLVEQAIGDFR